jgi:SAM-dependent methyltransferase
MARVTGIDFSATSVRATQELKARYGLDNLEVHQLPIERARDLGMTFDSIICTGVLHHLPDPDEGLAALRDVLDADGAMQLMVYAPYGRAGIYMLQEFCRLTGVAATDDGIRDLIAILKELPAPHPLRSLLGSPDFREDAELADALLNPQDRSYSVPQLFDFIRRGGLVFGRWVRQAPYLPQCGDMSRLPHAARVATLPPEERFAAAELFRGTMTRHSVLAYRSDYLDDPQPIEFESGAWADYVPIRRSETVCIEEGVPPGSVAVLINRTHGDRDLYLPIDNDEKQMFDAIDGSRRIAEIAKEAPTHHPARSGVDVSRSFFERLWWYDQVVFDAARPALAS